MALRPKLFIIVLGLLLVSFFAATSNVYAAPVDKCADGQMDKGMRQSFSARGQELSKLQNATLALFGEIDMRLETCFERIDQIFDILGSLSDPLALLYSIIASQILAMLDQICNSVVSSLESLKNAALSQFNRLCLPIPNFGLNLGSLNFDSVTCNGVSLYSPGPPGSDPQRPTIYDFRSLYPRSEHSRSQ